MSVLKIKDKNGKWIRMPYVIKIIQGIVTNENQVADIEKLIVSYFENKTVEEVEV